MDNKSYSTFWARVAKKETEREPTNTVAFRSPEAPTSTYGGQNSNVRICEGEVVDCSKDLNEEPDIPSKDVANSNPHPVCQTPKNVRPGAIDGCTECVGPCSFFDFSDHSCSVNQESSPTYSPPESAHGSDLAPDQILFLGIKRLRQAVQAPVQLQYNDIMRHAALLVQECDQFARLYRQVAKPESVRKDNTEAEDDVTEQMDIDLQSESEDWEFIKDGHKADTDLDIAVSQHHESERPWTL